MEMVLHNSRFVAVEELFEPEGPEITVYEVLRLMDGIPLFFDDHVLRFQRSMELVGHQYEICSTQLLQQLKVLSQLNQKMEGNILMRVSFSSGLADFKACFIPHVYPSVQDYQHGVTAGILHAVREKPEAKVANTKVRERANQLLTESGFYEVLLLDDQGLIREGSRSNFVAVKDHELYTAPLNSVLNGITLLKVLQIAKNAGITVHFQSPALADLSSYDATFLTGTSPKVLPIRQIAHCNFNVGNPLLNFIRKEYEQLVEADLKKRRDAV